MKRLLILLTFFSIAIPCCKKENGSKPANNITNPPENVINYLDQSPPGRYPVVFAPDIISTTFLEFGITFTPDGNEIYFTRNDGSYANNIIFRIRRINNQWSYAQPAPFSGIYPDMEPHVSPDGNYLFFGSTRPIEGGESSDILQLWYLIKTESGWSDPHYFGPPFENEFVMYPSLTNNGTIYYTGDNGIYRSAFVDGIQQSPERLSSRINGYPNPAHPFIDPDERFIIFDAQPNGLGTDADIFISFLDENGNWTDAVILQNGINSDQNELAASISPDGKYLFFFEKWGYLLD
jgi:Tol biopolymer transport system component